MFSVRVNAQAENTLLSEIKSDLQELYSIIVILEEKESEEDRLNLFDETELLISNLYYSLFASPLDLPAKERVLTGKEFSTALQLISNLEKAINIPEYNRTAGIIRNNISSLLK